jgi:alkylation response protein AidB-like acyl-CoA dehydrogenase
MPRAAPPSPDGGDPSAETELYLERVRALSPQIAAAAEQIDRERRIPEPVLAAMHDAGLFRLLLPRSLGGAEAHPLTFMRVVEAIAGIEASTAWVLGQTGVCAMAAAYLSPDAAQQVFGEPRAVLAWGPPGPDARAVASDGGYRVSGSWSFASGGRHATWLGAYCPIYEADGTTRRTANGTALARVMLVPARQVQMHDVWHVVGLRGTASDSFSIEDVFVPHALSIMRESLDEVREPGWLYAFKLTNVYACGFAAIAIGVARTMLDAFVRLAVEKTPRGYANPLRDNHATQAEVGLAEAQLRAARALLMQTVSDICAAVQRTAIRLASTHAIQQAMQVGDFAYAAAGATAIFDSNPYERRFRDLHAIAQQMQGRKSHFQTVGKYLLGGEADTGFL